MTAWLAARTVGGRVLLRVDDLDGPRSRPEYAAEIIRDLKWLGFDWDASGPDFWQSRRTPYYDAVLRDLAARDLLYPCFCSRRELRLMASAPNLGDAAPVYSGKCRGMSEAERRARIAAGDAFALRLKTPDGDAVFQDRALGETRASYGGDLAVKRSDRVFSYQFATAVDDRLMGVSLIVRGRDLAASTPGQLYIRELMGHRPVEFAHVPLVLTANGERMAKRRGDLSVGALRGRGVSPERIIGRLAFLSGLQSRDELRSLADLVPVFSWERLTRDDFVWDERFL